MPIMMIGKHLILRRLPTNLVVEKWLNGREEVAMVITVKALVVAKPDRMLDEDEVIEFCSMQLARYKCPSKVLVVTSLPRGIAGKLLRRELV